MPRKPPGKPVNLRLPDGGQRTVDLTADDFLALRKAGAEAPPEVKAMEKQFSRLRGLGLLTHEFRRRGDFPIAVAVLTSDGRQALTQDPNAYVGTAA